MRSLKLNQPKERIWFSSDYHLYHKNIIHHCNRPYQDEREMGMDIIDRVNQKVGINDILFLLGDFCWFRASYEEVVTARELINCKTIHLVLGNHDDVIMEHPPLERLFTSVRELMHIRVGEQKIVLCHYALRTWNAKNHGAWHLYGHSHGKLPILDKSFDVGVDTWGFDPINYTQVERILS